MVWSKGLTFLSLFSPFPETVPSTDLFVFSIIVEFSLSFVQFIFEFSDEICVESPLFIFLYLDSLSAFSSAIFLFDEVIVNILTKVTFFPLKKLEERDK